MYFFDTYAIIELIRGSLSYERFKNEPIVTSVYNMGELYLIYLRENGKESADNWFSEFNCELLEITPKVMIDSIHFRYVNRKKNISLADSIGYILALKHNIRFLTGDKEFENMQNVEFVK